QAARIAAAGRIVVVDSNPAKEAVARQFGATEFVVAGSDGDDLVAAVKDLGLANGADHVFECVGHPALIRNAIDLLDWGGTCTLLGVPKLGTEASFVVNTLYNDKAILGCRYGATRPHHAQRRDLTGRRAGRVEVRVVPGASLPRRVLAHAGTGGVPVVRGRADRANPPRVCDLQHHTPGQQAGACGGDGCADGSPARQ